MENTNLNNHNNYLINNSKESSSPKKRPKFSSSNSLDKVSFSDPCSTEINDIFVEQLLKLEYEQEKLIINNNCNVQLVVAGEKIHTTLPSKIFLQNFKSSHEMSSDSLLNIPCEENKVLIFRNNYSKKRNRREVKLYLDNLERIIGEGGLANIRKIVRVGSDKEKVIKEVIKIERNQELDEENKTLSALHKELPFDPFLNSIGKNLKHLGIQDAYTFGEVGGKEHKSYLVGKLFTSDGFDFQFEGLPKALAFAHQLAFGVRALDQKGKSIHDLKAENTLVEINENFPGGLRIVLSDLTSISQETLIELYSKNKFDFKKPFGEVTEDYIPKEDLKKICEMGRKLKECIEKAKKSEYNQEYWNTLNEILHIRQKNMVSLLGQMFSTILGDFWSYELVNKELRDKNKELKNEIAKGISHLIFAGVVTTKEKGFSEEFAALILKMTEIDYKLRPTPKEVLSTILIMIKKYDPEQYEMIVKNRWTDGYADWN